MPTLTLSVECYAGTFASIQAHFDQHTLERSLPALTVPTLFVLATASPIPVRHGVVVGRHLGLGFARAAPVGELEERQRSSGACRNALTGHKLECALMRRCFHVVSTHGSSHGCAAGPGDRGARG